MKYDAIIIGTGQAGPSLAASLASHGLKVAIIEKADLGGTCVNTGCTPTKAYMASARRVFMARSSEPLGVRIKGSVEVDLKIIKNRKDNIVNDSKTGLKKLFDSNEHITLIQGKASFTDDSSLEVNGETYYADKFYINVGAKPSIPKGFENINYLTNESILELEEVPEHLMIVGGGYVGLEFGQMFSRFGSKVTILERGSQLLKKEDPEFGEAIQNILEQEGITIALNSECTKTEQQGHQITVKVNAGERVISGSHILLATGRQPNTQDLGLEHTSVNLNDKGYIDVDDELKTSAEHIWALGDCNGQGAFTHTAYNDCQIVISHLFEDRKRYVSDRFTCYAAFIDPPIARVGMNRADLKAAGIKAKIATKSMSEIARAKEMGETHGLLNIYIECKSNKFLGATFLGVGADEFIHLILDQMYANQDYKVLRDAVHIHPTVSELLPTMLENLKPLD
ncbi:mercuric reductase [Psychroflexus montanilacus]|uniref:mercuric reductase n=1 Tax=Psychroflexus montanilacus TaxID=2873598 RepID=UPI001CCCDA3D|nr:mercuric reductase [Psychroflexus montanilacus]MBZ9650921.1 mercuric reductase [Psychroflexus montanilacus]